MKSPNDKTQRIAEEVEKTLAARHHLEPDPFFYSKLISRMEREAEPNPGLKHLAWLSPLAFASFFLVSTALSLQVILSDPSFPEMASQTDLYDQLASDHFMEETGTNENWYY